MILRRWQFFLKTIKDNTIEFPFVIAEIQTFLEPAVDPDVAAASMVWSYIGELVFRMLVLVGAVKMADRIVQEMMGL